jgi:hypothetical protein
MIPTKIATGVPTEIDVKRLREAYPQLAVGQLIPYEDVARVIGAPYKTGRFRVVTEAWRKWLRRSENCAVKCVAGRGFMRMAELERSEVDRVGWRKDQGRAARKVRDLARVDTLSFEERDRSSHDHARRVLQAHVEHTAGTVRELAPPAPVRLLPRRSAEK